MKANKKPLKMPKEYVIDGCEINVKKNMKMLNKVTGKYFKVSGKKLKKIMSSKKYRNTVKKARVKTEIDVNKLILRALLKLNGISEYHYFNEDGDVIICDKNFTDLSCLKFNKKVSVDTSIYFKKKYLTFVYLNALKNIKKCEKNIKKSKDNTKDDNKIKALNNYTINLINNTDKILNKKACISNVLSIPYSNTIKGNCNKEMNRKAFAKIIRDGFNKNSTSEYDFTKEGYEGIGLWLIFNIALESVTGKKLSYKIGPKHFVSRTRHFDYTDEVRILGKQIRKNKKTIQKPFLWYLMSYPLILSNYGNAAKKDPDLYLGILALAFTSFYIGSEDVRNVIKHLMSYHARGKRMKTLRRDQKRIERVVKKNRKKINKTIDRIMGEIS